MQACHMYHTPVCTSSTKQDSLSGRRRVLVLSDSFCPCTNSKYLYGASFRGRPQTCSSPFLSSFQRGQSSSTEAPKDFFKVNFCLTPQASVCNCSSLLPERNFLAAVPFARQTSLAVRNTRQCHGSWWQQDCSSHCWNGWVVWGLLSMEKNLPAVERQLFSVIINTLTIHSWKQYPVFKS